MGDDLVECSNINSDVKANDRQHESLKINNLMILLDKQVK